ncbi:MAG: universal stress protein, partial [Acidimicrobiia bacterium]|nr:universal stress protein [Acidimicrobiia bacterium]
EIARAFNARTTLVQVLVQPPTTDGTSSVDPLDWHLTKAEAEAYLAGVVRRLHQAGTEVDHTVLEGHAAAQIINFAHRHEVDLIALSSHGRSGLTGWNVSSVAQKIILHSHLSTLLVRAYQCVASEFTNLRYRRLMVTLDCSRRAECALPLATGLARLNVEVLLTHVVRHPEMPRREPPTRGDIELTDRVVQRNKSEAKRYFTFLQNRLSPDIPKSRPCLLVDRNVAVALHEFVDKENADLVIMSAHGHSGGSRWPYGSVATSFIVYGNTPLLIVQDLEPGELDRSRAEIAALEHKGH